MVGCQLHLLQEVVVVVVLGTVVDDHVKWVLFALGNAFAIIQVFSFSVLVYRHLGLPGHFEIWVVYVFDCFGMESLLLIQYCYVVLALKALIPELLTLALGHLNLLC